MTMICLVVRPEYYRQSLRRRLFRLSRILGNGYHVIMVPIVIALAGPVVFLDILQQPYGFPLLGTETALFFTIILGAITLIFTGVFAGFGFFIL